jgi:hypothetical protein
MAIITGIEMSTNSYFQDQSGTALTTSFVKQEFGFKSFCITLANDANGAYIEYSFDGTVVHGRVKDTDSQPKVMTFRRQGSIWLRGESGAEPYRLEVY